MVRKFYTAEMDAEGGGVAEVVQQEVNVAEMMAKHGRKSDESNKPLEAIEIPGKTEEKKAEEPPKTATVKEEKPAEKEPEAQPEKKEPKEEAKKAEPAPIVAEQPKAPTLDEVLKKNQPEAILKALGFGDEMIGLVSELKEADPKLVALMQAYKDGTLGNYVKELSTDYLKMTPEEVMRHQLKVDYPKATQRQLDILYKKEIVDAYNLDSEDEDAVAEGKELLAAKADKYRDSFVANQEKYLLPKQPEAKPAPPPDNTEEVQAQQRIEAYRKELQESPYTKDIIANKKITLGEGEDAFGYPIEATALIDILSDGKKWAESMWDADTGEPKIEHQLSVAAFALDSKRFLTEYAKHLKAVGAKQVIEPIENAKPPEGATPAKSEPDINDPAKAMAKYGKKISGGI